MKAQSAWAQHGTHMPAVLLLLHGFARSSASRLGRSTLSVGLVLTWRLTIQLPRCMEWGGTPGIAGTAEPLSGLPGQGSKQKLLDEMDARIDTGLFYSEYIVEGPITREKYLSYFRPMEIGEASVARHGGSRKADVEQVEELTHTYRKQQGGRLDAPNVSIDEDVRSTPFLSTARPSCWHLSLIHI